MNRSISNKKYKERGSVTVEFAVVLPLLLTFLFGVVEFGRVLTVSQVLIASAREGARKASLPGASNSTVLTAVENALQDAGLQYDAVEFYPSDVASASRNEPVKVVVKINYESIGWVPGFFSALNGLQLEGISVMRKEGFG